MGSIQVSHVGWRRPGGAELLRDVSFTVGNGERVALVGANGVGKSTLLRLIAGEAAATAGTISIDGRLGVMRQIVGDTEQTVRDLLVSLAPQRLQEAAARLAGAEAIAAGEPMRYATALAEWGDAGGYDAEVFWDACCTKAIGEPFADLRASPAAHVQRRRAEAAGARGSAAQRLRRAAARRARQLPRCARQAMAGSGAAGQSQDDAVRQPRSRAAGARPPRRSSRSKPAAHGPTAAGSPATTRPRQARLENREHALALYEDERKRLEELVVEMRRRAKISEKFAPRLKAAESRLRQFIERSDVTRVGRVSSASTCVSAEPHRQAGAAVEQLELARPHRSVRPRAVVRRARRRAGRQRRRQEPLPARARRRSLGRPSAATCGSARASWPACSTRPTSTPSGAAARLLQILHDNDVSAGRPWACCAATRCRAAPTRPSTP